MRWLRRLSARFLHWLGPSRLPGGADDFERLERELPGPQPPPGYRVLHLSDDPEELLPETLYAIGENGYLWHFMLVCPCGCGATIALNALPDDSPRWMLNEHVNGPTLSPSVWRTAGCCSHFILRRGQVIWCHGHLAGEANDSEFGV